MSHEEELRRLRASLPAPWRHLDLVDNIDSTNDALLADPRPWRVLIADHQQHGRGRLDRSWQAPPGTSLAMSATVPLPHDTNRWGWVPLLVGVAVRSALTQLTDLRIGLKWPNDILVRSGTDWAKVGGILCTATGGEEPVVVIGIGLNLYQQDGDLPIQTATSLRLAGAEVDRAELALAILRELAAIRDHWHTDRFDDSYRSACVTLGRMVRIQVSDSRHEVGEAVDIDGNGRLVLQTAQGRHPHAVGDVVHVRPDPEAEPVDDPIPDRLQVLGMERATFVDQLEERLLGGPRSLKRADVSQLSHLDPEEPRRFWRALGFANARDEDTVFTELDVASMQAVSTLIADGRIDHTTAYGLARAVGRSTDRMAMWILQLVTDMVSADRDMQVDSEVARVAAERVAELADDLTPLIDYVWRRNLAVAISRLIADSEPESHVGVVRTVGFADLVNFTQLVRELEERELAALVIRFESLAGDIVSRHGGAIVKTVGDEVLFSHTSVTGAVAIALDLIDATAADALLPRMRVGMATGRVLARLGDIYGTTVNRASRLTSAAAPGTILADCDIAQQVVGTGDIVAREVGAVDLSGLGELTPWLIARRDPAADLAD